MSRCCDFSVAEEQASGRIGVDALGRRACDLDAVKQVRVLHLNPNAYHYHHHLSTSQRAQHRRRRTYSLSRYSNTFTSAPVVLLVPRDTQQYTPHARDV